MLKNITLFSFMLLFIFSTNLSAQKDWQTSLKEDLYKINWIRQANDGTLLVGGDKGVAGVDPVTGEVSWINDKLDAVDVSTVSMIDELPFFMAKTKNLVGKESLQIINAVDGTALLNSTTENVSVMDYKLYADYNGILFQIKKDGRYELAWYDLGTASSVWSVDIDKAKGGLKGFLKGKTSFLNGYPIIDADNNLVVIYKKTVRSINIKEGTANWSNEYDKDVISIISSYEGDQIYVGVEKKLDIIKGADGQSLLSEPIKLQDKLLDIDDATNEIFVKHNSGFNILDPKTNTLKWEKVHKPGKSDQVIRVENGYLSITKNEESAKITLMNKDGKKIWNKGISGALVYAAPLRKGVFYISTAKSNILDYPKGDKINDKDVKIKGNPAIAFDEGDDKVIVFSNKTLTTFDVTEGTSKVLAKDVKFEKFKDEEDWVSIDVREKGYFISSSQNNALINRKGKVMFNNHYKPVSSTSAFGALTAIGGNVLGVDVAGAVQDMRTLDAMMQGSFQSGSTDGATAKSKTVFSAGSGGSTLLGVAQTRYMATKENKDFVYIFMKGDKSKQVVKVDKDTGKTISKVMFKTKNPIYHIDEFEQTVISVTKGAGIKCHDTSN